MASNKVRNAFRAPRTRQDSTVTVRRITPTPAPVVKVEHATELWESAFNAWAFGTIR